MAAQMVECSAAQWVARRAVRSAALTADLLAALSAGLWDYSTAVLTAA